MPYSACLPWDQNLLCSRNCFVCETQNFVIIFAFLCLSTFRNMKIHKMLLLNMKNTTIFSSYENFLFPTKLLAFLLRFARKNYFFSKTQQFSSEFSKLRNLLLLPNLTNTVIHILSKLELKKNSILRHSL